MNIGQLASMFALAIVCATIASCFHEEDELTNVESGDAFVGVWQVTTICSVDHQGAPKQHFEVGHGAVSWAHVNNNSSYAIYKKSGAGNSAVYGLMISEEFADYDQASKKDLINWNSTELSFTAGEIYEPAGGDGCLLPLADVASLKADSTKGAGKGPGLHANEEHVIDIWLFRDSAGDIRPAFSFDHGGGPIHRGIIH